MTYDLRLTKALAYITRPMDQAHGETGLLVFDHRDDPEADTQVPPGTVEAGESVEAALVREGYVFMFRWVPLDQPIKLAGN
jgi:hypothetical protein